jgi:hypothetical protein
MANTNITPLRPKAPKTTGATRPRRNRKRRTDQVAASLEVEPIALPVPGIDTWSTEPIRAAAKDAADLAVPESNHVARLLEPVAATDVVEAPANIPLVPTVPAAASIRMSGRMSRTITVG